MITERRENFEHSQQSCVICGAPYKWASRRARAVTCNPTCRGKLAAQSTIRGKSTGCPVGGGAFAITLTHGLLAVVDEADAPDLLKYKWHAHRDKDTQQIYAMRGGIKDGRQSIVRMHRQILGLGPGDPDVDHIDLNGLNNRRSNLRPATPSGNSANRGKSALKRPASSQFKGVSFHRAANKWQAHIRFQRRQIHLGLFTSEAEAAKAYDAKAIEVFGEFARPNFPRKEQVA